MVAHKYTLVCEDVRMENNGKFIVLGLFTNGIATTQIPFPCPTLTLFHSLNIDTPGQYKFRMRLMQLENGSVIAQVDGGFTLPQPGAVPLVLKIPNPQFKAFGTYTVSLEIEGQPEPFLTEFQVTLVTAAQINSPLRIG
jgi:hypothetical protein